VAGPKLILLALASASLAGILMTLARPDLRAVTIVIIALSLVVPIVIKVARRKLDLFEPLLSVNVALAAMFVIRPAGDLLLSKTDHIGYDIMPTFDPALVLALLGVIGFQVGYASAIGRRLTRLLPVPVVEVRVFRGVTFAIVAAVTGVALYGLFIAQSGGLSTFSSFFSGTDPSQDLTYVSSTGYFYRALLLTVSASMLLLGIALHENRRGLALLALAVVLPQFLLSFATGARATLLIVLGGAGILWFLAHDRRPRLWGVLAVIVLLTLGIGFLREFRASDAAIRADALSGLLNVASSPVDQLNLTFNGADNEMFDSLTAELLVVPSHVPFAPGSTLIDVAIRAVPRPLWPAKPLERNDAIVQTLWPAHYAVQRASPAFSIIGPLYADSGQFGVFLGMFLFGICANAIWTYVQANRKRITAQVVYATALPLMVIFVRGSLPDTLSYVLFLTIPAFLFDYLVGQRRETT
jgi:hypothetical protein